ncbi:carbohydrate kinase family protein [Patescibacteria group bacterium]|nr:MAG: carbohydrate kinase family protein [Patescibacteria group bacterium]
MGTIDFLAIGDTVVDEFIELEDARVNCQIDSDACTISMRWGDKIPFKKATLVAGVGNAANAAVSASRLGLNTALVTNIGKDRDGDEIIAQLKGEKLKTSFIERHRGIPSNHHFVLSFQSERTILVKHESYPYKFPKLPKVKAVYLSSLGNGTENYHDEIASWLEKNPEIFLAFQPGTFQMKIGKERLERIYKRTNIIFVNKEEAGRILGESDLGDIKSLADKLHALGPKIVVITDGRNGAFALENGALTTVPMFPDPAPPVERTGAGDAFSSTTTAYFLSGLSLEESMKRGSINSAYVVQEIGAQKGLLTRDALESKLN